jgi:hypothetical protein
LAHRCHSQPSRNPVAFGAKQTFGGLRLQRQIYEYAA